MAASPGLLTCYINEEFSEHLTRNSCSTGPASCWDVLAEHGGHWKRLTWTEAQQQWKSEHGQERELEQIKGPFFKTGHYRWQRGFGSVFHHSSVSQREDDKSITFKARPWTRPHEDPLLCVTMPTFYFKRHKRRTKAHRRRGSGLFIYTV